MGMITYSFIVVVVPRKPGLAMSPRSDTPASLVNGDGDGDAIGCFVRTPGSNTSPPDVMLTLRTSFLSIVDRMAKSCGVTAWKALAIAVGSGMTIVLPSTKGTRSSPPIVTAMSWPLCTRFVPLILRWPLSARLTFVIEIGLAGRAGATKGTGKLSLLPAALPTGGGRGTDVPGSGPPENGGNLAM